jgi:hypothetical protein
MVTGQLIALLGFLFQMPGPLPYISPAPSMAIPPAIPALIAHVAISGSGTTSAIDTTGANFCVANVTDFMNAPTPSDSGGGLWLSLNLQSGSAGEQLWYTKNAAQGPGHTFTVTTISGSMQVACFSNVAAVPLDQQNGNSVTGGSVQFGSITPTSNGQLLISGVGQNNVGASIGGVDSGYAITDITQPILIIGGALAYLVETTAAAQNPTWTVMTGSAGWSGTNASFKP